MVKFMRLQYNRMKMWQKHVLETKIDTKVQTHKASNLYCILWFEQFTNTFQIAISE